MTLTFCIEIGFLGLMGLWTALSIAFALPFPRVQRWIDRHNQGLWVARWTMFGAARQRVASVASYLFEFRDRDAATGVGNWIQFAKGRPWTWHAGLWQPERRIADRLHRIAQDIDVESRRTPEVHSIADRYRPILERYIETIEPRPNGTARDIRIWAVRSTIDCSEVPPSKGSAPQIEPNVIALFSTDDTADKP